jgi:hypothetical protein
VETAAISPFSCATAQSCFRRGSISGGLTRFDRRQKSDACRSMVGSFSRQAGANESGFSCAGLTPPPTRRLVAEMEMLRILSSQPDIDRGEGTGKTKGSGFFRIDTAIDCAKEEIGAIAEIDNNIGSAQ